MKVRQHSAIADIDAAAWNRLHGTGAPMLRHEFLAAGENTGCVTPETGWQPRHLCLYDGGELRAAMPLYEKQHSWGEFVFDWAWARAYEQAGLDYYPKLVSTTPFTPATGSRLLLADRDDDDAADELITAALQLADEREFSSLHLHFVTAEDRARLTRAGFLARKDCQFHWRNNDYASFDDFLSTFSAAKRKKARRDRRRVAEQGIRFRQLHGNNISTSQWQTIYALISHTFLVRGSMPYYNEAFFVALAKARPADILVVLAERDRKPCAAAVFLVAQKRLYGRYWGSDGHYDALHFETCYYQGIDYCIANGLEVFEPGTQGEHKISRGFAPVTTWSAHWLADARFASAIGRYLDTEAQHIDRYIDDVATHTPYRRDQ